MANPKSSLFEKKGEDFWVEEYKKKGAYWAHDYKSVERPHALLTSGNHSDGFFDSRPLIEDELLIREAAAELYSLFKLKAERNRSINKVVGPATGATKLAALLANEIYDLTGQQCGWASPVKVCDGGEKKLIFKDPNHTIRAGERVLLCEDVITTGESINLTTWSVIKLGGLVKRYVLVLVNRSGRRYINGKFIISLVEKTAKIWTPEDCPLCSLGSEAIRPKGDENWARPNAEY